MALSEEMPVGNAEHWNRIWGSKQPETVSWFEAEPAT